MKTAWNSKLAGIVSIAVCVFMGLILFYLGLLSFFGTAVVTLDEVIYFTEDTHRMSCICLFVGIILVTTLFYKRLSKCNSDHIVIRIIGFLFSFLPFFFSIYWVFAAKSVSGADQRIITDAAYQLNIGDYSLFEKASYFGRNPHQLGLVFFEWLLGKVFGFNNYTLLQYFNCFFVLGITHLLGRIGMELGLSRLGKVFVYIGAALFLPLSFYATFCYGNLMGIMFILLVFLMVYRIFDKPNAVWYVILFLSVFSALMAKQNYQIGIIAIVLYVLVEILRKKYYKRGLITIAVLLLGTIVASYFPKLFFEKMTGIPVNEGASSLTYIAMGLDDSSDRCEGWFNDYNATIYEESGYDKAIQAADAKRIISERLTYFRNNPDGRRNFFANKNASQWIEPTFQCIWVSEARYHSEVPGEFASKIYGITGQTAIRNFLDVVLSLIYFGALLGIVCADYKKDDFKRLPLYIYFIGGFLFHLFWEAKGQYTFTYVLVLLPLGIMGYLQIAKRLANIKEERSKTLIASAVVFGAAVLIVVFLPFSNFLKGVFVPENGRSYEAYYSDYCSDRVIEDGYYYVKPCVADNLYLVLGDDNSLRLTEEETKLHIVYFDHTYSIIDDNTDLSITYVGKHGVNAITYNGVPIQAFRIYYVDEDVYTIGYRPNELLTVGNSITLEDSNPGSVLQEWYLVKVVNY